MTTSNPGGGFRPCCFECKSAFQTMAAEYERLRAALERIAYCAEGGSDVERIAEDALGVADEPESGHRNTGPVRTADECTSDPSRPDSPGKAGSSPAEETSAAHKPGCWKLHSPSGNGKCNCGAESGEPVNE